MDNFPTLNIDEQSKLSPVQIKEMVTLITSHLVKHGKITLDLINVLKDGPSPSTIPTSNTPKDRPILLSSDKMSSSTASHHRFTIPQLSRYFGFRSLKNWENLHNVCQPNFSIIHPSECPMELGNVANIKKSQKQQAAYRPTSKFLGSGTL
jgi:hypothetical protein